MYQRLITTLIIVIISFLAMRSAYRKVQNRNETIKEENRVLVNITDVYAPSSKRNGTVSFRHNGGIQKVTICPGCSVNFKIGEQIPIYYNAQNNTYISENDGLGYDPYMGWYVGLMLFIAVIIYWLCQLSFKGRNLIKKSASG